MFTIEWARVIDRIRRAIRDQRYRFSFHAIEEMAEDELESEDVESIILTGGVAREFTRDPRGRRYEVIGETISGRRACVVCRFLPTSVLLIITVYAMEE